MNIKVIFSSGGQYNTNPEQKIADDDTVDTAQKIADALSGAGHDAQLVKITPYKINHVKKLTTDVVFNLCEWSGRDYQLGVKVLKALETNNIPYTGADSKSYDWCSNKVVMKEMFDQKHILTPIWNTITIDDTPPVIRKKIKKIPFPLIVKPAYEHCAIGIDGRSVVYSIKDAINKIKSLITEYKQPLIVEEYIQGREFAITIIKNHTLHYFPPTEVIFKENSVDKKILSFDTKWSEENSFSSILVNNQDLAKKLKNVAKNVFAKMGCRGYVRIDTRLRDNKVYVLEVNVNPSILPDTNYGLTVSTEAKGWNFVKLVDEIANAALD